VAAASRASDGSDGYVPFEEICMSDMVSSQCGLFPPAMDDRAVAIAADNSVAIVAFDRSLAKVLAFVCDMSPYIEFVSLSRDLTGYTLIFEILDFRVRQLLPCDLEKYGIKGFRRVGDTGQHQLVRARSIAEDSQSRQQT
jgi:hypothetical protein